MQTKFLIGGLLIAGSIIFLMVSSLSANTQYYMTIDEIIAKGDEAMGRDLRVSGAVLGETITVNPETLEINFSVVNVPGDNAAIEAQGGMGAALHNATLDPTRSRIQVVYYGPKPDLLKNEAQAIMTGRMGEDGRFYATELLLKCPSK
jgi:cytochrome c-type biogenesis protein CcmE